MFKLSCSFQRNTRISWFFGANKRNASWKENSALIIIHTDFEGLPFHFTAAKFCFCKFNSRHCEHRRLQKYKSGA